MLNQVTIGKLNNYCRLYGSSGDAHLVGNELKRISENLLPQCIGAEINRQLNSLNHGDGVYRIKKLCLKLTLLRSDLLLGHRLADVLAQRLIVSLAQQLSSESDNVVYFESNADYITSLMVDLLLGRAWQTWLYDEFKSLRFLDATEAVVQLLLPRDDMLHEISSGLLQSQQLSSFLQLMNSDQSARMFRQWTGHNYSDQFNALIIPQLSVLKKQLLLVDALKVKRYKNSEELSLLSMRVFFYAVAQSNEYKTLALLWVSTHYSFMQRYGSLLMPLLKQASVDRVSTDSLLHEDVYVQKITTSLLQWAEGRSERISYLKDVYQATQNSEMEAPEVESESSINNYCSVIHQDDFDQVTHYENVGLILLFPVLISLQLHKHYPPAVLRVSLMIALYDDEKIIQPDWFDLLLPEINTDLDLDGIMPQIWRLGISENKQKEIELLSGDLDGSRQLACLLLAQFAARMSGLQHSSANYLRTQFLQLGGVIKVNAQQIIVQLEPMPLYIVLRMAGFADWQTQLPLYKYSMLDACSNNKPNSKKIGLKRQLKIEVMQ